MKIGFVPISLEGYIEKVVASSPEFSRKEVTDSLKDALRAYKAGVCCKNCGKTIWVIGSAMTGWDGCFTCITGKAMPAGDYEIDEACG